MSVNQIHDNKDRMIVTAVALALIAAIISFRFLL